MTNQAILVHVPLANATIQIELAAALAKEWRAHLTGFCTLTEAFVLRDMRSNPFLRAERTKLKDLIETEYAQAARAEAEFRTIAVRAGVQHSWFAGEGDAADLLIHACRLQDLAILAQSDRPSELLWGMTVQLPLSGHATLIVPRVWTSKDFGRRVLVAWNGTAQAAAAMRRALPLLQRAEAVTLLTGTSRETFPSSMRLLPLDPVAYLRHQGVTAKVTQLRGVDATAGEAILDLAAQEGIDLIVMGAFGRSRFREWILGGATRHVLENTLVPAFMAHQ